MIVFLLLIICILYAWFVWRWKAKSPKLPSYSGALPLIGHAYLITGDNTKLWEQFKKLSMECLKQGGGFNISIGPITQTVFVDPEDCGAIMNSSLDKHYVFTFGKEWYGEGLFSAGEAVWTHNRKLLYPMFNQQGLNGFLGIFNTQAKRFVSQLEEKVGKGPFDHQRYLLLIGLETVCQSVLGINVGDQVTSNEDYLHAISELLKGFVERFSKFWLHADCIFNWSSLKKRQDVHSRLIHNMSETVLHNRKEILSQNSYEDANEFKPFVDRILKISMEKGAFTDRQIRDELNTIIVAGYDTIASTLVYALMLLGTHRDIQDRVYKELLEVFQKSNRDVEKHDLPKLVYMEAVLKETLRLYPAGPVLGRHNVREIKLKNCVLPAGSDCFISIYGLHRHPMWGPDVEEFRPERWLDRASLPENPTLFGGFGLGKRSCIGKTYGLMSMKTTLAHVLRRYRVTSDITKLVLKLDFLLKPASGQHIAVESRT